MSKLDNILAVAPLVLDDVSLEGSASSSGLSTPDGKSPSSPTRRRGTAALRGRDARPFLNGLLFLAMTNCLLGGVSIGVGQGVDSQLGDARNWRYEFWWGGALVAIIGILYLPCHLLLRRDYPVGRHLFMLWIFCLCVGEVLLLVSASFSGKAYNNLHNIDRAECAYIDFAGTYTSVTDCYIPCQAELARKKGNPNLPRTCCCCRPEQRNKTLGSDDLVFFKETRSCNIMRNATTTLRQLSVLYILSFFWLSCALVVALVVACGCCRVIPPWFSIYMPSAAWLSIN